MKLTDLDVFIDYGDNPIEFLNPPVPDGLGFGKAKNPDTGVCGSGLSVRRIECHRGHVRPPFR